MKPSVFIIIASTLVSACSPVKQITNLYTLESFSKYSTRKTSLSIFVTRPEAVPGYQTNQMLYRSKPFELSAFAANSWVGAPADMLYPLIVRSIQATGFFKAVASGPYTGETDYRLDSQLIALDQNFILKPSQLNMVVKVLLSKSSDEKIVASHLFTYSIPCPMDNPYGGVLAANKASQMFTLDLNKFLKREISKQGR